MVGSIGFFFFFVENSMKSNVVIFKLHKVSYYSHLSEYFFLYKKIYYAH